MELLESNTMWERRGASAGTGVETDFVGEAGESVHDFTPAVVGMEVEVIFIFTSSWAWKRVVDGDGPRGGGLYPKGPTNKPVEIFRTFVIDMRHDIRTWPANLGLSESILSVPQVTRQFHVLPLM